jgi:hypothetical protein
MCQMAARVIEVSYGLYGTSLLLHYVFKYRRINHVE